MNIYRQLAERLEEGPVWLYTSFDGKHEIGWEACDLKKGFVEKLSAKAEIVIFGGGYVGQSVAKLASFVDMPVTVIDSRKEFANSTFFPTAKNIYAMEFSKALEEVEFSSSSCFVICTRGHESDTTCLKGVLRKKCNYIGMIGSKGKVKKLFEELKAEGYTEKEINKVHSPIGLDIGGDTPNEIAVGIIAQIMGEVNKDKTVTHIENSVLKALSVAQEGEVCCTIYDSRGSAPRKNGTRMLVKKDGTHIGTVGGGIVEAKVIERAKELINSNASYHTEEFTLCDIGMVCGGHIWVFFEKL